MPVVVPEIASEVQGTQTAGPQPGSAASGEITDDLVSQVTERVMELLLLDLKYERERRRSVGRPDRLKGVR